MQAIAQDRYGAPDALEIREVDRPIVGDDDVLVRVQAASANPYDLHFMRGRGSDSAGRSPAFGAGTSPARSRRSASA
jgi:NADPH:quinone reductase-like Zn-dependent oxidoreductase